MKGHERPEYQLWLAMKRRCKSHPCYKGRGITVCNRWQRSFVDFFADVGPRPSPLHSLDRKDNDGNYEPGNVRWATKLEQSNNSRRVRLIEFRGETMSVSMWARRFGLTPALVHSRLHVGWSVEKALTTSKLNPYQRKVA